MRENVVDELINFLNGKGCATASEIARNLGMSLREVNTLLGVLIGEGVVEEVDLTSRCRSCPLSGSCGIRDRYGTLKAFKLRSNKLVK